MIHLKIAAFSNTSSEIIVKKWDFKKIFLPSDKVKDSEIVIKELEDTDYFICLGQKPAIKNKICLELVAKNNADEISLDLPISEGDTPDNRMGSPTLYFHLQCKYN